MNALKFVRIAAWVAVALTACLLLALYVTTPQQPDVSTQMEVTSIGGPFRLTSHKGEIVDNARLAGKPYFVFFGFTHCPDVCPTTLYEMTDLMKELGTVADRFQVLFVSVDPERDTQDLLALYLSSFDERILALRGSRDDTDAMIESFRAYARKVPTADGQYTMDHTAGIYMMDANGRFAGMLDMHESRDVRLEKIRRIAGAN